MSGGGGKRREEHERDGETGRRGEEGKIVRGLGMQGGREQGRMMMKEVRVEYGEREGGGGGKDDDDDDEEEERGGGGRKGISDSGWKGVGHNPTREDCCLWHFCPSHYDMSRPLYVRVSC